MVCIYSRGAWRYATRDLQSHALSLTPGAAWPDGLFTLDSTGRRATDRNRTGNGERRKTRTHSRMEIEPLEVWCTLDQRIIALQICTRTTMHVTLSRSKDAMKARLCVTVLLCAAASSSYAARAHSLPHYLPLSF